MGGAGRGGGYVCIHVSGVIRASCGLDSVVRRGSELAQISLPPPRFQSVILHLTTIVSRPQACRHVLPCVSAPQRSAVNLHVASTTFIILSFFSLLSYNDSSGFIFSRAITF